MTVPPSVVPGATSCPRHTGAAPLAHAIGYKPAGVGKLAADTCRLPRSSAAHVRVWPVWALLEALGAAGVEQAVTWTMWRLTSGRAPEHSLRMAP